MSCFIDLKYILLPPTKVTELATVKSMAVRHELLNDWFKNGGVMIMGYEAFRNLTYSSAKCSKYKEAFQSLLLNPGKFMLIIYFLILQAVIKR